MKYELMVILSPKQTDKEIEKNLKEIKGIVTENGYDIVDEDLWGMREMSYSIKGNSKAYYAVYDFVGEPEGLPEIQKDLRLQTGVLRYMAVKMPNDYVMMRYDQLATTGKAAKLSSPAEELSKKVRSQTRSAAKEAPQETGKLDASLKAIIEDKDL
ncbi:MAG: 30S ribosomal protein S6 [Candidatus Gracilibacteria bacterium]